MWVLWVLGCRSDVVDEPDVETTDGCEVPGAICTFAGRPQIASFGQDDVPATEAGLYLPLGSAAAGPNGEVMVLDWNNHRVRQVAADGIVTTVAGTGFLGDGPEGPGPEARMDHPTDLAFDPIDPDLLWIAVWHAARIEQLDLRTGQLRFVLDTTTADPNDDAEVRSLPVHVAVDGGDLYYVDMGHVVVRRLRDGEVVDIAGTPDRRGASGDGGLALDAGIDCAELDPGCGIAIRGRDLFLADATNGVVRVIDLDAGTIDRFADGFDGPTDIAVGPDGDLYVADEEASCVRRIGVDGEVTTFAGTCGTEGFAGDGGPAADAVLNRPMGVDVGPDGTVYISDTYNHVIRAVQP